jgi:tetratricopeptide (TPR) repeat protein
VKTRHSSFAPRRWRNASATVWTICLLLVFLSTVAPVRASDETNVPPSVSGVLPPQSNLLEPELAPEPGLLPTPGVKEMAGTNNQPDQIKDFQTQFELARKQRVEHAAAAAARTLVGLLETNVPPDLKRPVLFELALAEQDSGELLRAQQVFAQYLQLYPDDSTVPEVLLREGLLYRQMGLVSLAIPKFYAVMSTALKLKLDHIDYYKKLVLQAQVEIADTYYMEGKYDQATDYFSRLLKTGAEDLDKTQIQFKLIRSLASLTNHSETVAKAQVYLETHPASPEVPEVRFLLASALKKLGRNQESMKQVLLLLQSEQDNLHKDPQTWAYWQRKAGTEIAEQLYKEGDYLNALEIYLSVSDLDKSPAWQLPVWYRTALTYEQLQQWQKADETYQRILDRRKELTDKDTTPSLVSVFDMAAWRKDYIAWMQKAKVTNQAFQRETPAPGTPGGPALVR